MEETKNEEADQNTPRIGHELSQSLCVNSQHLDNKGVEWESGAGFEGLLVKTQPTFRRNGYLTLGTRELESELHREGEPGPNDAEVILNQDRAYVL